MLNMLHITADAPTMIFLNGQPAGETSAEGLWLPAGDGPLIFQAFPMERGLLPITAKIDLVGEETRCCGALKLYLLRKDQIQIPINYERIAETPPAIPYVLKRADAGNDTYASVYFDRVYCFALERGGRVILGGAFQRELSSAEIHRRGNTVVFCGKHSGGTEIFAISIQAEPRVLLHADSAEFSISEQAMEYARPLGHGVFARERFGLREGKILSRTLFREKQSSLLAALALAIKEGAEDFAMSLVHPALRREADFSAFREFMGDFREIRTENGGIGLCYALRENVYRVRQLRADIKDEQIANIEERED